MNKESWEVLFASYVTNGAFRIDLSKNQVQTLLTIRNHPSPVHTQVGEYDMERFDGSHSMNTIRALMCRGFIWIKEGQYFLTPIGIMVASLIDMAEIQEIQNEI